MHASSSELGNVDLAVVDQSGDLLGALAIDSAAERDAGSEDLLDGASGLNSHALGAELLGDVNDVVELEVAVVLHVLLLLSVTRTLLQGLNDKGSSSR